jgi:hypothetical protein
MPRQKRMLLWAALFVLWLVPMSAYAVTVTIYGAGGIQLFPPKICPDSSSAKCADVQWDSEDPNPSEVLVQDALTYEWYTAYLAEPIPPETEGMQGSELEVDSIVPVE